MSDPASSLASLSRHSRKARSASRCMVGVASTFLTADASKSSTLSYGVQSLSE